MEVLEKSPVSRPIDPPLSAHLLQRVARDFTPRLDALGGRFLLHGRQAGPNAVRLDGNDYLGITGHPAIVGAQLAALRKDNEFVIQSGAFLHGEHPTHALEQAMAQWLGKEDGFICQSGSASNTGLLQAIAYAPAPV